jgi:hypothetical protein
VGNLLDLSRTSSHFNIVDIGNGWCEGKKRKVRARANNFGSAELHVTSETQRNSVQLVVFSTVPLI